MLKKITIQNYKSVQNLNIELGRFNVFIGENGCGKSNILEAIAIGSAALGNKLDNEFLVTRGIRITEPDMMVSRFDKANLEKSILVDFEDEKDEKVRIRMRYHEGWIHCFQLLDEDEIMLPPTHDYPVMDIEKLSLASLATFKSLMNEAPQFNSFLNNHTQFIAHNNLYPFLIYAPENYFLRRFEEEGQIKPLGVRGEGLFKHLVDLFRTQPNVLHEIKTNLKLIDWFDDFEIPQDLFFGEKRINIRDRFLPNDLAYFDQRSANEGFLYLLFYFTLFISPKTPRFFAIDNIDNALNPKLCAKLISTLTNLAAVHQKQVILTTHNPAVLDGLDLTGDNQRLFVVYRNADGHTTTKRVMPPKSIEGVTPVRLSEAFIRGYLGGLPKNF
jgi:AAA15 family ATPase/GTPase